MTTRTLATWLAEMRAEADARGMLTLDADVLLALLDVAMAADADVTDMEHGSWNIGTNPDLVAAIDALRAHLTRGQADE